MIANLQRRRLGAVVGQTTSVGLATTYTGLCLTNPIGSAVKLALEEIGLGFLVAFTAAAAVGLMTGFNASTAVVQTTPITPQSAQFNGVTAGTGLLASAATLPSAPVVTHIFGAGLTGAITTVPGLLQYFRLDGSLVLMPGAYCAIYTSTASGASALAASFSWEEIPL